MVVVLPDQGGPDPGPGPGGRMGVASAHGQQRERAEQRQYDGYDGKPEGPAKGQGLGQVTDGKTMRSG